MKLKTIKNVNLTNKRILLRSDLNVPLNSKLQITENTRIKKSLPTIKYILSKKPRILLITSHLGRPNGKKVKKLKLDPVAKELQKLLRRKVTKLNGCTEEDIKNTISSAKNNSIYLLENTRFYPDEEKNSKSFSKKLADLADIFINDAFGVDHRAHATTEGITHFLPSYAGLLVEKEIKILSKIIDNPKKPFVCIIGGAKISTKLALIKKFLKISDYVLLGGALANTLLEAHNIQIGKSLIEPNLIKEAKKINLDDNRLKIPVDTLCSITKRTKVKQCPVGNISKTEIIYDIGPDTIELFSMIIAKAKTIIWNGPMGLFEIKKYRKGTEAIAKAIAKNTSATTVIGGGDTLSAIKDLGIENKFTHISTGGGAMLMFLEGKPLPGIVPLLK